MILTTAEMLHIFPNAIFVLKPYERDEYGNAMNYEVLNVSRNINAMREYAESNDAIIFSTFDENEGIGSGVAMTWADGRIYGQNSLYRPSDWARFFRASLG